MVKRTSMLLETTLVDEAAEIFGTATATDTVRKALEEAVRREKLRKLAAHRFPDGFAGELEQLRAPRTFEGA